MNRDERIRRGARVADPWEKFLAGDGHFAFRTRDHTEIARGVLDAAVPDLDALDRLYEYCAGGLLTWVNDSIAADELAEILAAVRAAREEEHVNRGLPPVRVDRLTARRVHPS